MSSSASEPPSLGPGVFVLKAARLTASRRLWKSTGQLRVLEERIQTFASAPVTWDPAEPDEDTRLRKVAAVKSEIHNRLHALVPTRVFHDQLSEWVKAYLESSVGSARRRARRIRAIYEIAAPILGEIPDPEASQFLGTIRNMFRDAAEAVGAKVLAS